MTARPPQATFALIDPAEIAALRADIADLKAALQAATVIPAPEWVTVADAARRQNVSTDTIRRRVAQGIIQAKGAGKMKRVKV